MRDDGFDEFPELVEALFHRGVDELDRVDARCSVHPHHQVDSENATSHEHIGQASHLRDAVRTVVAKRQEYLSLVLGLCERWADDLQHVRIAVAHACLVSYESAIRIRWTVVIHTRIVEAPHPTGCPFAERFDRFAEKLRDLLGAFQLFTVNMVQYF